MPISIPDAVDEAGTLARAKADQTRNVPRYAIASMLAGAYVGVAVVLLLSVGAPLVSSGSPFAKLVQGAVFGVALTLVVFAGAELFTGNAMTMLQGLFKRQVTVLELAVVWVFSLVGNFVGALGFAAAVNASGVISLGALPGKRRAVVVGRSWPARTAPGGQLFWRAVSNALVCLGLDGAHRSDGEVHVPGGRCWRSSLPASSTRLPT
jgi:nitrite transporter NirC